MGTRTWRIGELAAETGLTVRALRHYEHEGLLVPSGRTAAGHRVYSNQDVARLYEVLVLRRIGLGLAAMMAGFDFAKGEIIVPMDGDLQNDPGDIPVLLAKLDELLRRAGVR